MSLLFDKENKSIQVAIDYVARQILEAIKYSHESFYKWNSEITDPIKDMNEQDALLLIKSKCWLNFSPSETPRDINEIRSLLEKYKDANNNDLLFYFFYHGCDSFVILLWTIFKINGSNIKICEDKYGGHFFLVHDGKIINPLWEWAGIKTIPVVDKTFDDPYTFISKTYMREPYQDWEQVKLDHLKRLMSSIDKEVNNSKME